LAQTCYGESLVGIGRVSVTPAGIQHLQVPRSPRRAPFGARVHSGRGFSCNPTANPKSMTTPARLRHHSLPILLLLAACCPAVAQDARKSPASSEDTTVTLNEFVVSTDQDSGYRATNSISGTRLNQKLSDVAQNIQVI